MRVLNIKLRVLYAGEREMVNQDLALLGTVKYFNLVFTEQKVWIQTLNK
jgi:hypothetical protein